MDVPSAVPVAKAEPLAQQQAQVQVPPGVSGGQLMTVQLNGQMLQVQVPAGAGPGDTFAVAAPNAAAVAAPVHATPVPMSSGMNDAMYARELQRQEMGAAVMPGAMGAGVEHLTPAEQLVLNYQHSIKCFAMIDIFFTVLVRRRGAPPPRARARALTPPRRVASSSVRGRSAPSPSVTCTSSCSSARSAATSARSGCTGRSSACTSSSA